MKVRPLHYRVPGGRGAAGAAWYLVRPFERLLSPVGPGTRVLDVGCGNGYWSQYFFERGCTVVGIDPSPSGVEFARKTVPEARFEQLAASRDMLTALGEAPFDLVVSMEVVEHLYSPREWAEGCFAALRRDGRLVCSTPYHGYLKNLLLALANRWGTHFSPLHEGGHIKLWSRATLPELLVSAGFRDVQFRGAGRMLYLWKSMVLSADKPAS